MCIQADTDILASARSIGITEMVRLVDVFLARAKDISIDMPTRREYGAKALAYQMRVDIETASR